MSLEHITVFTGETLTAKRYKNILKDNGIDSVLKEDKIIGYEISNNSSELLVVNADKEKALKIIGDYKS